MEPGGPSLVIEGISLEIPYSLLAEHLLKILLIMGAHTRYAFQLERF